MSIGNLRRVFLLALIAPIFISFSGCVTAEFSEPATSFQESINNSSFIIIGYYEEANKFEREIYMNECLFDPEKELLIFDNGKPTPLLTPVLSAESIRARADALILIGIYAYRLGELANNESPAAFHKNSIKLGKNLQDLGKTFNKLSIEDTTAIKYSGPISTVIGVLGKMYLTASRDNAIENAIEKGYPAVDKILEQVQKDLCSVIIPLQKTGLKQEIAKMSAYYNNNRKKFTLSKRRSELSRINKIINQYDALLGANPANLIQEIRQANTALIKYAKSSRTPNDLAEFVSVLDNLNRDVKLFARARARS